MRPDHVPPTGEVRTVAPHELFFSVTDRKGVITAANSVFERLSAYGRAALLGSPHNLIRHPEMPAGVFRAMWDTLGAGRPFAGYVRNLAADGASYDVFATVVPVGDGFLSVRSAPACADLHDTAHRLYQQVRAGELALRDGGAIAADAARAGAADLAALLGAVGFTTYEELMYTALPAEVTARVAASGPHPRPTGDTPAEAVLAAALDVDAGLADALGGLDDLADLVGDLQVASQGARATARDLRSVTDLAASASARVATAAPVLARTSDAMGGLATDLVSGLDALAGRLADVRTAVMEQRFRIALARLQADMVVAFAAETIEGDVPADGLGDVRLLCRVLHEGLDGLAAATVATTAALDGIRLDVERARDQLSRFRTFLTTWRLQVPRYGVQRQLGGHVGPVDDHLGLGHGRIAALRELAQRCLDGARPLDQTGLSAPVARLSAAVAALLDGPGGEPGPAATSDVAASPDAPASEDRVPEDRVGDDRVPDDRVPEDRVGAGRVPDDRVGAGSAPADSEPEDATREGSSSDAAALACTAPAGVSA